MKTLVSILGNVRMPYETWDRFKKYVLDELNADLVLCIHVNDETDRSSPYFKNARYIFEYENKTGCWSHAYDQMNPEWRNMLDIPGDWIGGVKQPIERKGSGGILIFLRWFLYQNLSKIDEKWDRLILTRSDYFWTGPHPDLDNDHIWLINSEFHGGLPDRHCIIPAAHIKNVLNVGKCSENTKNNMIHLMNSRLRHGWGRFMYNVECFIYLRFLEMGILEKAGFFPMNMFLIDKTSVTIHPEFKVRIKYPSELEASRDTVTWPFHIDHTYINRENFVGRVIKI